MRTYTHTHKYTSVHTNTHTHTHTRKHKLPALLQCVQAMSQGQEAVKELLDSSNAWQQEVHYLCASVCMVVDCVPTVCECMVIDCVLTVCEYVSHTHTPHGN